MNLTQKQDEVIRSKARYKVLTWGRRSGKTTVFAYEALGTALTIDNANISYYAQTYGDARDIAWKIFLDTFGDLVVKKNETLLEIVVRNIKGGTSTIRLKGWESVANAGKGRGTENDLLLLDEVAFCKGFTEFYDTVLDPTLLTTKGRAVFGSTPNGFNYFYDLAVKAQENKTGDWFYSHATSYDNSANDSEWLDNKKREITEDRFAQEYMADFRKMEGLVYKEFDRTRHIEETFTGMTVGKYCGIDFGFTNPTAIITIVKDRDNHYHVTDEWYKTGQTAEQIIEAVKNISPSRAYPDPEDAEKINALRRAGIYCMEVSKDVIIGIDAVRTLFLQNRLHISKHCKNLIDELESYRYEEKKAGKLDEKEKPVKEHDHALDALRYVLYNLEKSGAIRPSIYVSKDEEYL